MEYRSTEFYHAAIKNSYPNACDIRQPDILGVIAPVFLADVGKDKLVCKFNQREVIFHNKVVSDLLQFHDIPAPRTRIHAYLHTWFESYKYNDTKTLHELIQDGLSDEDIFNAYCGVFELQSRISQIPVGTFAPPYFQYYKSILEAQQESTDNMILGSYRKLYRHMSNVGSQILLHNDIHDRNILYSPESKQAFLIDLDAVSLCNENFTMLSTLQRYPLNNFYELMNEYEKRTGRKLDRMQIMMAKRIMAGLRGAKEKTIAMLQRQR